MRGTPAQRLTRAQFEGRLPHVNEWVAKKGTIGNGGRIVAREDLDVNDVPRRLLSAPSPGDGDLVAADLI